MKLVHLAQICCVIEMAELYRNPIRNDSSLLRHDCSSLLSIVIFSDTYIGQQEGKCQ